VAWHLLANLSLMFIMFVERKYASEIEMEFSVTELYGIFPRNKTFRITWLPHWFLPTV
jgi:hypothetical protein